MKLLSLNGLLILLSLTFLLVDAGAAAAINLPASTVQGLSRQSTIKVSPQKKVRTIQGCPKLVAKELHIVRVVPLQNRSGARAYRYILNGTIQNRGLAGVAVAGLNVSQKNRPRDAKRVALKLFKQRVQPNQRLDLLGDLHVQVQSEPILATANPFPSFSLNVLNMQNDYSQCGEREGTSVLISSSIVRSALPARLKGGVSQRAGTLNNTNKNIKWSQPSAASATKQRAANVKVGAKPVRLPQASALKKNSRSFINRLPVDAGTKRLLATGESVQYLVLTNAFSSRSRRMERRSWRGQILLPDLRQNGREKAIHVKRSSFSKKRGSKKVLWVIENRDGSLSKPILNGVGQLAGNLTITKDGSIRIGLDLNGDKVADLYELQVSDGEHSILFSPAGQVAWERFQDGGANPLCSPGANPAGGGYAGGMISGADKTAMQVVCGQSSGSQGGGSSGGASSGGGISGDPGGRAMDSMCKRVLSKQHGRPGPGGMVMGDPAPEDREEFSYSRALHAMGASFFHTAPNPKKSETGQNIVTILGTIFGGGAANATNAIGDGVNAGAPRFVNEADRDLKHFEEWQDSHPDTEVHPDPAVVNRACAAGSTSRYCGAWHREHDGDHSAGSNSGGNSSDPGPDQQNDPDAALLAMCQARAQGKAMRDASTKDTSYVHELCENPASQPNPAGQASDTTLGGSYGSSITLSSYCGQHGGPGAFAQTPGARTGGNGRNCGRTESPGTDGRCRGVGNLFNGGSAGSVNVSYGAVIGFTPFNPGFDPDPK